MHSFLGWLRRVSVVASLVFAAAFFAGSPRVVHASSNLSFDAAWASCQQYGASYTTSAYWRFDHCGIWPDGKSVSAYCFRFSDGFVTSCGPGWPFDGVAPASNPCTGIATTHIYLDGKVTNGFTFTQNATNGLGATVQCAMRASVSGAPVWNPWSGKWQTYATMTPTGDPVDTAGVKDATGAPSDVGNPSDFANQPTTPSICDGGSCYNAATDQYCASSGGTQYCLSGATARTSTGGCSGSSAVLCGGSPSAPLPPPSKVPDPPTAIVAQSKATQADPNTGATLPVVVNIYKAPDAAGPVTNGQTASDSGPAPASSTASKGTASGGQDCNSPPICSGDAPTCAVVSQTWLSRCKPDWYDKNGDGTPDWVAQGLDNVAPNVPDTPLGSVVSTDTTGTSAIDESGWAGNTCPQLPSLTLFGKEITYGDQSLFCQWLATLRPIFLLFCGFIAARILASGGKS